MATVTRAGSWRPARRAVGRVALFIVIVVAILAVETGLTVLVLHVLGRHPRRAPAITVLSAPALIGLELFTGIGVAGATAIMARWERRPISAYGVPWRRFFERPFWGGALTGLAGMAVVMGAMIACGSAHVGGATGALLPLIGAALLWALAFGLVGLVEELLFRGYVQTTLGAGIGFWPAAAVTSIVFALMHVPNAGESLGGAIGVFLIGMFFCFGLQRFGDLRWAIGFHAAWDWTQTALFGTADSGMASANSIFHTQIAGPTLLAGGNTGPEATIFAPIVLAAIVLIVAARRPLAITARPA